jgi:hypothetical protein
MTFDAKTHVSRNGTKTAARPQHSKCINTSRVHTHRKFATAQLLLFQLQSLSPSAIPFHAANNEEAALIMATSSPIQERPLFQPGFRRSFTLPPRSLSYHEKAGLDPSDSAAEFLYSHSSARIIKFSPPYSAIRSVSSPVSQDLDYPVDTVETLPWASTTETTVASGALIIEKVQGSTNFLKSGTVMHAILRNSQCWCVDGESKFVLRIGKFQYYRIELPTNSDDDRAKVEELKVLLKKILRFERTPCPFKRGFHVDLPESDITPRRKGTWKRRQSSQVSASMGETPSPLSRGRSSRTEVIQAGTRFGNDGQEDEQFTNGSEFDEDEVHSESDGHEEHTSHSPVTPISEPTVDGLDTTKGVENEKLESDEDESAKDESDNGKAITDESAFAPEQPELTPEQPPSPESRPSLEETEPIPEVEPLELEVDPAEINPFIVEDYPGADAEVEATSQSTTDSLEAPAGELSPLNVIAPEPALVEIDDEDEQTQELDENEADNADGPVEMRNDSRPIDTMSIASSSNSFHSFDAPESPTSPISLSPPDSPPSPTPRAEALDPLTMHIHHAHKRELSELTITPSSPGLEPLSDLATASPDRPSISASDQPMTPQLAQSAASDGSWTEVETPSGPHPTSQIRHRLKARRSLSPLPPSPTLFTPSPQQDRGNHLTSAILQKACSIALGKPIEVVVMLVHILVRIAGGATVNDLMNGNLFKKPGQEREHQRNRSLPDHIDGKVDDDLDEDDFGVPLKGRSRSNEIGKADDDADSLWALD